MNELISARFMFVTKWVFPLLWFSFLACFLALSVPGARFPEDFMFVAVPLAMAGMGFYFFKTFIWDMADTVHDQGTHLIVRRGRLEERIALENIMNVNVMPMMSPPRVTLRLVTPGVFGDHVSFSPKARAAVFMFAPKHPIIGQLIERTYAARTKGTA